MLSLGLVPVACFGTGAWLLHTITLLATLVALAGMLVGLGELGRGGAGRQFVAGASSVSDAFFTLVILAEALPDFLLSPCWS
jgi:F0F1-type ATP synthase membrane subunit c/vacuolar-type H+-ATPase subunit K